MTTLIPLYLDEKSALNYIRDEDKIHISWELEDGRIISFEDIPENYPCTGLCLWENKKEYLDAINGVEWITNNLSEEFQKALRDFRLPEIESRLSLQVRWDRGVADAREKMEQKIRRERKKTERQILLEKKFDEVHWEGGDIEGKLKELGLRATKKNIEKAIVLCDGKLSDAMVGTGWSVIEDIIELNRSEFEG